MTVRHVHIQLGETETIKVIIALADCACRLLITCVDDACCEGETHVTMFVQDRGRRARKLGQFSMPSSWKNEE